jgi:hypothetical protein
MGNQIKVIPSTVATSGQSQTCLQTSYDGNTTALLVHTGTFGNAQDTKNVLLLLNNQGDEFARTEYPGGGVEECSVSPDGFYIYPNFLINKSLYEYSRLETQGLGGYSHTTYSSSAALHFLHGNGLIAGCKNGDQCAMTISENELTRYSDPGKNIRVVDSSFNDVRVIFDSFETVTLYENGTKLFQKEVNAKGREPSASISMGGQYIIYSYNEPTVHNADFKIVTNNNIDKTPAYNMDVNENVIFVHANDKGLFYLAEKGKVLSYYQVGSYTTDYNPPTPLPSPSPEKSTSGLSYYFDGAYYPANVSSFTSLEDGVIYVANRTITLDMESPNGSLFILDGTIFSVDQNLRPILLKGQMTANFSSPAIIYALKFDRFDMEVFRTKLNQFRSGTLANNDYFVIKNIHTKFKLTNQENQFVLAVESGQVEVTGEKIKQTVEENKQITIDAQNAVKQSIYFGWKLIVVVVIIMGGVLFFGYRKIRHI